MPTFDFQCEKCEFFAENVALTFQENEKVDKQGGLDCPACETPMKKVWLSMPGVVHKPVRNPRGKLMPGDKRGQRQLMQERYRKRNKRLENMPEPMKKRMVKFFEKYNIRKTPPPFTPGD